MNATNKIAWITGAGSGIGKQTALKLAGEGYTVLASARRVETLTALKEEAGGYGNLIIALPCDVSDEMQVDAAIERIHSDFGPVDVLVNNAGTTIFRSFIESSVKDLDRLYNVNLRGAFLCSKAVIPKMLERGEGTIVMINSMAADHVFKDSSVYSATKSGLQALANGMRLELRSKGLRVISVYPGATSTPIWPEPVLVKYRSKMMEPVNVADSIYHAISAPHSVMIENISVQPIGGGL